MNHQDSGTIIVTFLLLLPWLGRAGGGGGGGGGGGDFPRNLAPAFTHYFSERPEMSSQ